MSRWARIAVAVVLMAVARLAAADVDGDGIEDGLDNCPYAANSGQEDAGGTLTLTSDGIGDVCQCGDITADGVPNVLDVSLYRRSLSSLDPAMPAPQKCDVAAPAGSCDAADVARLRSVLAGAPPGLEQVCAPAQPSLADLTLTKTHTGSFTQGQFGVTYTLTVSNVGAGLSSGVVTVDDTVPNWLTVTAASGDGWICTVAPVSCTRSDPLAAGAVFPAITLTADVAPNAPATLTNTAVVSGFGDVNLANNTASDPTTIVSLETDLTLEKTHAGSFTRGQIGATYTLTVQSSGTAPTSGLVTVSDTLPTGLTATAFAGTGWSCSVSPLVCTRSDALAAGASYPPITLTVNVAANAPVSVTNVAAVSGGGDANAANNGASDLTAISSGGPAPAASFPFNEGLGTTAADTSGGLTGTLTNGPAWVPGKYGNAVSLDGIDDHVDLANPIALQLTGSMTVSAWIKSSTFPPDDAAIVSKRDTGGTGFQLDTTVDQGARTIGFKLSTGSGSNMMRYGATALQLNTWYHVAGVYDAGAQTLNVYLNGQLDNGALVGTVTGAQQDSSQSVQIGQRPGIPGSFNFAGTIDDVRIYSTALTPAEIQADMITPLASGAAVTAPSDLTATVVGIDQIDLTWTASTSTAPIAEYQVERCQGPACTSYALIGTTSATTYSDLGVVASTNYAYRVRSLTSEGVLSGYSNGADAYTGFSIAPRVSTLTSIGSQQFGILGIDSGGVIWSVNGVVGGSASTGTISATGLYSPPAAEGTYTVTATTSDLSQSVDATVHVTNYPGKYTHHNDNLRTGQNLDEPVLRPQNVNFTEFGKLRTYPLDGVPIASPLYVAGVSIPGQGVRNVVYVATAHNSVYAFDADGPSTSPLWQVSYIDPAAGITTVSPADTGECCDIAPEIGIVGTPVIDPSSQKLYVVAKTKEVVGPTTSFVVKLHAIDIRTGAEVAGSPVVIQGSVPGDGSGSQGGQVPFDSLHENQRPALLLSNGVVYVGFASHGDVQPYHGWVFGYDAVTLQRVLMFNVTPDAEGGGIWHSGGGLSADADGNIYFVTGDGTFTASIGGRDYGDSFVKLSPSGVVLDYFTPYDQLALDVGNHDLGAGGLLLLPDQPGPRPRLLTSAGKNDTIYLVDRDDMGEFNPVDNSQIVQSLPLPNVNFSMPVYFNGRIYYAPVGGAIRAYDLAGGEMSSTPTSQSTQSYGYPGAALAISANGASDGILWAFQRRGSGTPGVLRAYDTNNLGIELYNSDLAGSEDTPGIASKFCIPLVANGRVYVGGLSEVTVYGLLP